MNFAMTVRQGDNGWILEYVGHDGLDRLVICLEWDEVQKVLDDYFGWWDYEGKHCKKNPYRS